MLTNIRIRNFKKLKEVEFELGKSVVLIGPNNSGKTTALQALALWDIGLRRWLEKRGSDPKRRSGVAVNRRDLIATPIPSSNLLWHNLHTRNIESPSGKPRTSNVRIDITVDGVTAGKVWQCGFEFDYANEESFYCRPLRKGEAKDSERMPVPPEATHMRIAFLPPMSGLAAVEPHLQPGRINVLIGEGQTAQILRNLCWRIFFSNESEWNVVRGHIRNLFGVNLSAPEFIQERGEITMAYEEPDGIRLDLSSAGRGLQQTLLLLAHLYANPGTVLLLDEPDAHLEILRQRQIYQLLTDVADRQGSQIVAASHSEVVLNEAAGRDIVIAFVGQPHRIGDRGSQIMKSLKDIGFEDYYLAEQNGWVLYLEGTTDLAMLRTFARLLNHRAAAILERPFVHFIANNLPQKARDHFFGLREAYPQLVGVAVFDRLEKNLNRDSPLSEVMWRKRELENYLCMPEVLLAYARHDLPGDLFNGVEVEKRETTMKRLIDEFSQAFETLGKPGPWSDDIKATDEFLDHLFVRYFQALGLPNLLRKTDYHVLAGLVPVGEIDREIVEKLDLIVEIAEKAKPGTM